MAIDISSITTSAAGNLNSNLINQLKKSDESKFIQPIETKIGNIESAITRFGDIETLFTAFLDIAKNFDRSRSTNAFNGFSASANGDSAVFDVVDANSLEEGSLSINVTQLAQRDVWQSNTITDPKTVITDNGTINVKGTDITTNGKSWETITEEINDIEGVYASMEKVTDTDYRLVIKSDSGEDNALNITQTGIDIGLTKQLSAQDMKATVDGIDFSMADNKLSYGGLNITALETGISSATIIKDNSTAISAASLLVDSYNTLKDTIDNELYEQSSSGVDKGSLRLMLDTIKNEFFEERNGLTAFSYGFELDEYGNMSLDTNTLNTKLNNDPESVRDFFMGNGEDIEGLGEGIYNFLDKLDDYDGLLTNFKNDLDSRLLKLNSELTEEQSVLDKRYESLSLQYSSYASLITSMDRSFSGLKSMIDYQNNK